MTTPEIITQNDLATNPEKIREVEQIASLMSDDEKGEAQDRLAQKADELNENSGKIPERFLEPDCEIQDMIQKDYMEIGVNHPFLKFCWVNYVNVNGQMVWRKKAEGWKVCTVDDFQNTGDFNMAVELRREDGTLRVGDTLLMCIRFDSYVRIQQRDEDKRLRQQFGLEAEALELAGKYPKQFKIHGDSTGGLPPNVEKRVQSRAAMAQAARKVAANALGNQMKKGTIPGVPIR